MTAASDNSKSSIWARYWGLGAPHSLVGSLPADYGPEVGGYWRSRFSSLPDGASVLDLCTGSGILARLAAESRASLMISAVDLVEETPGMLANNPLGSAVIQYYGGVNIEALPIPDRSQDLVVSQFGVEYSDLNQSTEEIRRVLKPDGSVALVCHANDSVVLEHARRDEPILRWLLSEEGLVSTWSTLMPWISLMQREQASIPASHRFQAEQVRLRFNTLAREIKVMAETGGSDVGMQFLQRIGQLTQHLLAKGPEAQERGIIGLRTEVEDTLDRTVDLINSALDAEKAQWLGRLLALDTKRQSDVEPVAASGSKLGWRIQSNGSVR